MNNLERDHLYKFDMLDDPIFKTNVRNFNFKYVPTTQFEKVIKNVQKDRFNKHKNSLWNEYVSPPPHSKLSPKSQSPRKRRVFRTKSSTVKILTDRKKDSDKTLNESKTSEDDDGPKIRVMSDEQIHDVIENAVKEILHNHESKKKSNNRNNKKYYDKNDENLEKFILPDDYIPSNHNTESMAQIYAKFNQLDDIHNNCEQLEHKPTCFSLLNDKHHKEYDEAQIVEQDDSLENFEILEKNLEKFDQLSYSPPNKCDDNIRTRESSKQFEKLQKNQSPKEVIILENQSTNAVINKTSNTNLIASGKSSATSHTLNFDEKLYIHDSSGFENSDTEYEYEFMSARKCRGIAPSKNNSNFDFGALEIHDDDEKIFDKNNNQDCQRYEENSVTPKSCRSEILSTRISTHRSNVINSVRSNMSMSNKELKISTPNNMLDHILMTKKVEVKQKSKFHMDLEAIMKMRVSVRHEDEDSDHTNHDLESNNSDKLDDDEPSQTFHIIPESDIAPENGILNTKEIFSNLPVDQSLKHPKRLSKRSSIKSALVATQKSVNNTERSVNNTEILVNNSDRSLNNTERSVNNTERSVNNTERSVKNTARSANNSERSVNNTERSVNHTERSVNHTEESVIQTDRSVNQTERSVTHIERSYTHNELLEIQNDMLSGRPINLNQLNRAEKSSIQNDVPQNKNSNNKTNKNKNSSNHHRGGESKKLVENKLESLKPQLSPSNKKLNVDNRKNRNSENTTKTNKVLRPIECDSAYKEALIEIFSKVTGYQEKIIFLLKKLQCDLLDSNTWDTIEKKRREKNIMEFSTRFSRNYVYQIERMIEEIRVFTVEDFRKKKYSETLYVKVCGLYGLLYQALNSYINQLKYFIYNQYPKKLDILICMISTATKICIQKKFFDKDDALVRVIFEHCEILLNFINDLDEKRKAISKDIIIPKSKGQNTKWDQISGSQAKLSMYDTLRAGPSGLDIKKKPNSKGKKSKTILNASSTSTRIGTSIKLDEFSKDNQNTEMNEDSQKRLNTFLRSKIYKLNKKKCETPRQDSPINITTQIEKMMMEKSSSTHIIDSSPRSFVEPSSPKKCSKKKKKNMKNNNKTFAEADLPSDMSNDRDLLRDILLELQAITKKEVKQVLSPLLNHIGSLTKSSPQNAATILNKLNSQLMKFTDNTSESMSFNQKNKTDNDEQNNNDKENSSTNHNNNSKITRTDSVVGNNNNNNNNNDEQQNTDRTADQQETIILTNKQQNEAFENFSQRKLLGNQQQQEQQQQQYEENLQYEISKCTVGDQKNDVIGSMELYRNENNEMDEIEVGFGSSRITNGIMTRNNDYCAGGSELIKETILEAEISSPKQTEYDLNGCGDIHVNTNNNLEVEKDDNIQKILYERNVQYTFITSSLETLQANNEESLKLDLSLNLQNDEQPNLQENCNEKQIFSSTPNSPSSPAPANNNNNENNTNCEKRLKNLEKIFATRLEFIKQIAENPLYVNENFQDPWKIIGRISNDLIAELTTAAEKDINFGEENFVTDFLDMELNID